MLSCRQLRNAALVPRIASGAFDAICSAISTARGSSRSGSTTPATIPHSFARSGSTRSPVSSM